MNEFADKRVKPMLIGADAEAFDDPAYLYELKWDGERCVAYLDPAAGTTELINKRDLKMLPKVPELAALHKQVKKRCILDGELMVLKDGKPSFFEIQRRSLMSNKFRIVLAAKQYPASFVAFDILYLQEDSLMHLPLTERKAKLEKTVRENERLAVSRFVEGKGVEFYKLAEAKELEGIVAKRMDSRYVPGKRTKDWVKIKNLQDDDFVVCGYIYKEQNVTSLVLGQYDGGALVYEGHVTTGVNGRPFEEILRQPRLKIPPMDAPAGHGNEEAVWIEPKLVCTVNYMEKTPSGGLRQPVFKGLRDDKVPQECTIT